MKLTEHRYFRIGKGQITLFVSIPNYRSQTEVIGRFPGNMMVCKIGPHRRWRRLLDRLSRQMEVGQRNENPEKGVDFVEMIPLDAYWAAKREHFDWQLAQETQAALRAEAKRKAKQDIRGG